MTTSTKEETTLGLLLRDLERRMGAKPNEIRDLRRATGGFSQATYFFTLRQQRFVLRCPTKATVGGRRSIERQARLLQALEGFDLPIPLVQVVVPESESTANVPYFVMRAIDGSIPMMWSALPTDADRRRLLEQAVAVLCRIQAVPIGVLAEVPLTAPERPAAVGEAERWQKLLARVNGLEIGLVRLGLEWLKHNAPAGTRHVLSHGDFRIGNLVCEGSTLLGVLDWEMAVIGDPLADLAWLSTPVWGPQPVEAATVLALYEEATGEEPSSDVFQFYSVVAHLRHIFYALSGAQTFAVGADNDLRYAAMDVHLLPFQLSSLGRLLI